jgi:hypothetical protein
MAGGKLRTPIQREVRGGLARPDLVIWAPVLWTSTTKEMPMFGKLKKKAKGLAKDHGDKAEDAIDKGADIIDDKTGGEHTDKIEAGADKAKDLLGDKE